jgi:hypothetical protein
MVQFTSVHRFNLLWISSVDMDATVGAAHYRGISMFEPRISNDTRREPLGFTGSGGDIESQTHHGFMSTSHISNDAGGKSCTDLFDTRPRSPLPYV